jgi:predicted metal-dependent enzyme (double-stranded beta helix superfamily)
MLIARTRTLFETMVAEVAEAARRPLDDRPGAIAEVLASVVGEPALLDPLSCPSCPERYRRHLLHADPGGDWTMVALVWRPGQVSPVHAHHRWCALGVHQGSLTETFYQPGAEGPVPARSLLRHPGDCSHGPADPALIHRIANLGCCTALSIHVYGVAYERFGTDLNLVYAA